MCYGIQLSIHFFAVQGCTCTINFICIISDRKRKVSYFFIAVYMWCFRIISLFFLKMNLIFVLLNDNMYGQFSLHVYVWLHVIISSIQNMSGGHRGHDRI